MKTAAILALSLLAAGCTSSERPATAAAPRIPIPRAAGLDRVLGQSATALTQVFGRPDLDLIEGPARKLQFGSTICVLDAYLYSPASARGEPVVTHIDTRQRDGSSIDRASCVAALMRKGGGR